MENGTVTVRDRDSMQQTRISQDEIPGWLAERIR
jgi:glycyl-tRNA synthetase (class II)